MLCVAQDTVKHQHKWVQYALFTASVVSNAVGDGMNSREQYKWGHALNAVSIATLLTVPFVNHKPNWRLPVTYLAIRYALFDGFYNWGARRDLNYRGGKNFYNQGIGVLPLGVLNATKFASFGLSILITLK